MPSEKEYAEKRNEARYAELIKQRNESARKVYSSSTPAKKDVEELGEWEKIGQAYGAKFTAPYKKIREGGKLDVGGVVKSNRKRIR